MSVEPFHLFRYLDEQSFRYNERSFDRCRAFPKDSWLRKRQETDLRPGEVVTRTAEEPRQNRGRKKARSEKAAGVEKLPEGA